MVKTTRLTGHSQSNGVSGLKVSELMQTECVLVSNEKNL